MIASCGIRVLRWTRDIANTAAPKSANPRENTYPIDECMS